MLRAAGPCVSSFGFVFTFIPILPCTALSFCADVIPCAHPRTASTRAVLRPSTNCVTRESVSTCVCEGVIGKMSLRERKKSLHHFHGKCEPHTGTSTTVEGLTQRSQPPHSSTHTHTHALTPCALSLAYQPATPRMFCPSSHRLPAASASDAMPGRAGSFALLPARLLFSCFKLELNLGCPEGKQL